MKDTDDWIELDEIAKDRYHDMAVEAWDRLMPTISGIATINAGKHLAPVWASECIPRLITTPAECDRLATELEILKTNFPQWDSLKGVVSIDLVRSMWIEDYALDRLVDDLDNPEIPAVEITISRTVLQCAAIVCLFLCGVAVTRAMTPMCPIPAQSQTR